MEQSIRQQLSMVMTPQLQMAIKLLQMARTELVEQVQEELKENPLLEDAGDAEMEHLRDEPIDHVENIGETEQPLAQPTAKEQTDAGKEVPTDGQPTTEVDWTTFLENSATAPMQPPSERPDNEELPSAHQSLRSGLTLEDHLTEQLRMARLSPEEELVGMYIIRNLNADENWDKIAKKLKVDVEEVYEAVKDIVKLDPRPARRFSNQAPQNITPDVYINKVGESYCVTVNDDGMPKLRISRYYLETMKDKDNKAARDYVQDRLRSARWLIDSIMQRQRMIIKVTESILKFQRDFFEKGSGWLKPLILRDVASDIGMHEATISRATANKWVHTPQGLFPLKHFFNTILH